MTFNLLTLKRIYADTGAFKSLSESDLELLRDGDTNGASITVSSETLAIIVDLGARYRLDSVIYYRDAATSENVSFFGKQGQDEAYLWETLTYSDEGTHLLVDLTAVNSRFEFIKVVHTVTTGSAEVYELELLSDDTQIDFGPTGEATVFSVDSGTNTLLPEEIRLFNRTPVAQTFYCLPDGEDPDSTGLAVSATFSGGVYTALHDSGLSLPNNFSWNSGEMNNVTVSGVDLVLSSGTSGTFFTPVIDISSLDGRRLFWHATLSGSNEIDDQSRDDSVPTISVRLSNETPTDGGWSSGQLSTDSNWSTTSGILPFEPYDNYHIMHPKYLNYFQAKLEFSSPADGQTPVLHKIGIEEGLPVTVSGGISAPVYVKSLYTDHVSGRNSNLVVWFFESRNEAQ